MNCKINLNKIVAFIISLSPLTGVYKSPVPMMDLGFFLITVVFVISVFRKKSMAFHVSDRVWVYYLGYIIFSSFVVFIVTGDLSGRLLKQILYTIFILYFYGYGNEFDYRLAVTWYKKGTMVCTVYIFLQYAAYYLFSYGLPGYIPGLIFTESYADRVNYIATSSFFRPTSLTYEPTQYATFATIAVILYLFQAEAKKDFVRAIIISSAVILSTSSIGIACVMGIWLYWIYRSFLQHNMNRKVFAVVISVFSIMALGCFFTGSIGEKVLNRTFGSGLGMGGNATVGRFEAYGLLQDIPIIKLVFGSGYGLLDGRVTYYPSWAFNLVCTGIAGTTIVLVILFYYFVNAANTATKLIVALLFFKCIVSFEFSTSTMLFYFMFIMPMQKSACKRRSSSAHIMINKKDFGNI